MAKVDNDAGVRGFAMLALGGGFAGKAWQGPTLSGSLRGVTAWEALWRPGPNRKCIWEHVLHAAYWKYAVRPHFEGFASERPDGEEGDPKRDAGFGRGPANWPAVPAEADERLWKRDRAFLSLQHRALATAVSAFDFARLEKRPSPKHKFTYGFYLAGVIAHDCYHTGQIQLLKRLVRDAAV